MPALLGALLLAVITGVAVWSLTRPDVIPASVMRFIMPLGGSAPGDFSGLYPDLAISADGSQVIYLGSASGGGPQLYLRAIDQLDGAPLRGGEGGGSPFVCRDGEWVGFVDLAGTGTILRKVSILGGPPVTLAELPAPIIGASWSVDDQIIVGTVSGGLYRVPGGGGEAEVLTSLDADQGDAGHYWPAVIPGRRAVLFVTVASIDALNNSQLAVLSLDTGEVTRLGLSGVSPLYVPTGHLVYAVTDGSVWAVPFEASSLELTGNPVPLIEGVTVKGSGAANFSVSDEGVLVYMAGVAQSSNRTLALVGRNSAVESLDVPTAAYLSPRVSPDGEKIVVQTAGNDGGVLWIHDVAGNTQIRQLTFEGNNQRPVWTPDNQRITFSSDRDGTMSLYEVLADGSGVPERLTTVEEGTSHWPGSWSPDGETLLFNVQRDLLTDWDIWALSRSGRETVSLKDTPDTVYLGAEFSPDGKWIAYGAGPHVQSADVYVEPFPPTGAMRKISQNGGYWPLWSPDGDQLFYRPVSATRSIRRLRSVDVMTEPEFAFANEQALPIEGFIVVPFYRNHDITHDGERFIMVFPAN